MPSGHGEPSDLGVVSTRAGAPQRTKFETKDWSNSWKTV